MRVGLSPAWVGPSREGIGGQWHRQAESSGHSHWRVLLLRTVAQLADVHRSARVVAGAEAACETRGGVCSVESGKPQGSQPASGGGGNTAGRVHARPLTAGTGLLMRLGGPGSAWKEKGPAGSGPWQRH